MRGPLLERRTKLAKVEFDLPVGVSADDFPKLFSTFMKQRVSTAARDKAVRTATKKIIKAHQPEYDKYLAAEMPEEAAAA